MNETVRSLFYAGLIALAIRAFAFEPFSIPSTSMVPTLEVGDFLFVSKYSYGYSAKSAFFGMPLFDGRTSDRRPERGAVVVFKLPSDPSTDYIKRIIGLPGDTIQVVRGRLYINDTMVERRAIGPAMIDKGDGRRVQAMEYTEFLPGGVSHIIAEESDSRPLDNTPIFTVPEGHYFAMGDNRDNSLDSRTRHVGFVPAENLVGPAKMIFFSLADGARFFQFWKWPTSIRFDRIFDSIP